MEVTEAVNILKDGPQFKKVQALKVLIEANDSQYLELFRQYLKDKDWHLRLQAAWGVGQYLGKEALAELEPLLKDKAYGVREDVRKILDLYCQ